MDMSRYQVIAREIQYYIAQVEAEDDEAAKQVGSEMDPQEFEYLDGGEWEIVDVQLIPEPKPDLKKNQLNLFSMEAT
jgi:hypothetical protein